MTARPSDSAAGTTSPNASGPGNVVVVGAGLAGLACANRLANCGHQLDVFEASDRVGGRVRTEIIDGLKLDHGFQVLLTGYPACQELLDYETLRLRAFEPGALIRNRGAFARLGDPWRRPSQAIATALSPVGSIGDKLRIGKARTQAGRGSLDDLYQRKSVSTEQRLEELGFSDAIIDQFFRPFLGGVFLDESLSTSSRLFDFVFRMFAAGDIAVPADGMAAIPRQLADGLPRGSLRLNSTVASVEHRESISRVHLSDGTHIDAGHLVVATESNAAARLLDLPELATKWNNATTMYFVAERSPNSSKLLMLRGDESGPIQSATVLSEVAPEYASRGRTLISVSISDADCEADFDDLESAVRTQARDWFGEQVDQWELVQVIRVPYGLPQLTLDPVSLPVQGNQISGDLPSHVYVCGDHRETPSIQGAMNSGLRVADLIKTRK